MGFSKKFENKTEYDYFPGNSKNNKFLELDLSEFNPIYLKIYRLYNDPLETNYSAEDLE